MPQKFDLLYLNTNARLGYLIYRSPEGYHYAAQLCCDVPEVEFWIRPMNRTSSEIVGDQIPEETFPNIQSAPVFFSGSSDRRHFYADLFNQWLKGREIRKKLADREFITNHELWMLMHEAASGLETTIDEVWADDHHARSSHLMSKIGELVP